MLKQNRVLSHFQFAERFYVNTTYREQFHESIWRRLEKHLSSENNPLKKRSGGPKISKHLTVFSSETVNIKKMANLTANT